MRLRGIGMSEKVTYVEDTLKVYILNKYFRSINYI